jgi:serine/threonine-protein kinase
MRLERARRGTGRLIIPCLAALLAAALAAGGCGSRTAGPRKVAVPDLSGMSEEEAVSRLEDAGLAAGETRREYSDSRGPGTVISSEPAPGAELAQGDTVSIVVSLGPEPVETPGLVGLTYQQSAELLRQVGLEPPAEPGREYSETVAEGMVCAQDPPPGTVLERGTTVALTVSLGSRWVTCGNCAGTGRALRTRTCPVCGGSGQCFT